MGRFQEKQGETAGIKDFIAVLMLYREHGAEEIEAAVELALSNSISNSEGIRHLLLYSACPEETFTPLDGWPVTRTGCGLYGELGWPDEAWD